VVVATLNHSAAISGVAGGVGRGDDGTSQAAASSSAEDVEPAAIEGSELPDIADRDTAVRRAAAAAAECAAGEVAKRQADEDLAVQRGIDEGRQQWAAAQEAKDDFWAQLHKGAAAQRDTAAGRAAAAANECAAEKTEKDFWAHEAAQQRVAAEKLAKDAKPAKRQADEDLEVQRCIDEAAQQRVAAEKPAKDAKPAHVDPEYAAYRVRRDAEYAARSGKCGASLSNALAVQASERPGDDDFAHLSNALAVQALVATLSPDGVFRELRPDIDEEHVEALLWRLDDQDELGVPDPDQFERCVTEAISAGLPDDGPEARQWYGELLAAIDHRPPAGTRSKRTARRRQEKERERKEKRRQIYN